MEETKIEIYRWGRYVNSVADSKSILRQWIIDNCPYYDEGGLTIPENKSYEQVVAIAEARHFAFRRVGATAESRYKQNNGTMVGLSKLFDNIRIEDVAATFGELKKRGANYVMELCPFCGAKAVMAISPKYQMYKCFGCGKTGTIVQLVMEIKNLSFNKAIEYLETNFLNK